MDVPKSPALHSHLLIRGYLIFLTKQCIFIANASEPIHFFNLYMNFVDGMCQENALLKTWKLWVPLVKIKSWERFLFSLVFLVAFDRYPFLRGLFVDGYKCIPANWSSICHLMPVRPPRKQWLSGSAFYGVLFPLLGPFVYSCSLLFNDYCKTLFCQFLSEAIVR